MHLAIIQDDGCVSLGTAARAAGFVPGKAVQVVRLSSGNLLIQLAEDQPEPDDLSYLMEMHGRRALPRLRSRVDKEPQGE